MKAKANKIQNNEQMSVIKIWHLKRVAGRLSDKPEKFAGQNKNLPVLSDSPVVLVKTVIGSNTLKSVSKMSNKGSDDSILSIYTLYCQNFIS